MHRHKKNIPEIKKSGQAKTVLRELAREGVRNMIQAALVQEQEEFIDNQSHLLNGEGNRLIVKTDFFLREISKHT